MNTLVERARRWADDDPDPDTRTQILGAIERNDLERLGHWFDGRIEFGTAGLRAPLGPGPRHMCRLVVRQTAAGIARALRDDPDIDATTVVVGRDARHGSDRFAADIADVLAEAGFHVLLSDGPVPTPVVAFATTDLGAAAGIVVTASHNPRDDNGVKVYWRDGAQIAPPVDRRIADHIDDVAAEGDPPGDPTTHDPIGADVIERYVSRVLALAPSPTPAESETRATIGIVTTALHGVGGDLLARVFTDGGFADVTPVASQRTPDPDFPTVAFPNPEEPGALDAALALADDLDAELVIANDPDADRMVLAVPGGSDVTTHRPLRGDEIGALLAHGLLSDVAEPRDALLATTVVSSQLLSKIADAAGAHFAETLTGFKWLCRPGIEHPEYHQVLLYEEALGYAVGDGTRDKDGISAALVMACLAVRWKVEGHSVLDMLDTIHRTHGVHLQDNFSIRFDGHDGAAAARRQGALLLESPPTEIGGAPVTLVDRPASDVVRCSTTGGDRVVIRPSGTEPKLKFYCECVEPPRADLDAARRDASTRLATVRAELDARWST